MATATRSFSFNSNVEDWTVYVVNAVVVGSRSTTEESGNDTNAGAGALQTTLATKNNNRAGNYWYWAGTWEGLGVPAGATVTAVNIAYDWRCSAYTYGTGTNRVGPCSLTAPSAYDFSAARGSVTATSNWATVAGTAKTGLSEASNAAVAFRTYVDLRTANTNGAVVTMQFDWIVVTVTYTPAAEQHSGTAAVTSIGTTAYTAKKTGKVAATSAGVGATAYTASGARASTAIVPSVGATAYTGKKTGKSAATIAGVGATAATGEAGSAPEEHSGTAAVTGVGATAYAAAKTGKVAATNAGIGATAYTGKKGAKVAGLSSSVGATAYTGKKAGAVNAASAGIGVTAYTANGQRVVAVTLSGIGTVVAIGGGETPEEHSGSAAVTGIGATAYTGAKGGKSTASVAGIGATGYAAKGARAVAVTLPGIGTLVVVGAASTAEEHEGTAAVTGIGTIAVTYRHPIVITEHDSQSGSTTEYAGQSNGSQSATVGKATAVAHSGLARTHITKTVKITG